MFKQKIEEGKTIENKDSYQRLIDFVLERSYVKKVVMTTPYNASISMRKYITDSLYRIEDDTEDTKDTTKWYSKTEKESKPHISYNDITLLVSNIHYIVNNDL